MKTIKICLIGDSHLAALKLGFDKIANEFEDVQVTFFGSFASSFNELIVNDRKIVPQSGKVKKVMVMTSGGQANIVVDDYDLFILHGLELSFQGFVNKALQQPVNNQDTQLQSLAWANLTSLIDQCLSIKLAKKFLRLDKPVLLSPQPFLSEQVAHNLIPKWELWHNLLENQGKPTHWVMEALAAWEKHLVQLEALKQPPATVIHHFFTKNKFSVESIRLCDMMTKHGEEDVIHMNPEYGEIVIRFMIERCKLMMQDMQDGIQSDSKNNSLSQPASTTKQNPYLELPDYSFWRRTVANKSLLEVTDWYRKKFDISSLRIATAGSCFAQHIGRRLRQQGFDYVDVESAPDTLSYDCHLDHGYGMYSARYGNIYTTRQLLQLFDRAYGEFIPKDVFWEKDDGFVDPFRPTIQPKPFATIDELVESRNCHLEAVKKLFKEAQVFVFTLGLTEAWVSIEDGAVFPVAPGVSGGRFSPSKYRFMNLNCNDALADMRKFMEKVRQLNPTMKFILTVSPVPLMATATRATKL